MDLSVQVHPLGAEPLEAPRDCPVRAVPNQSERMSFTERKGHAQASGLLSTWWCPGTVSL